MAAPEPADWSAAHAKIQRLAAREVLKSLEQAYSDIVRMLNAMQGTGRVGELVRAEQLRTIQRNMLRQQAMIWRRLGDVVRAGQLEAAARAITLGSAIDDVLLAAAGREEDARALKRSLLAGAEQSLDVAMTRMSVSAVPLADRIYKSRLFVDGSVQRMINSALARGLSAREFAREARDWFNPNVPGGTRYAAMRLARTEINNAFHAMSVMQASEKPWIRAMKWHLSRSHPKADTCDLYAKGGKEGDGVYPTRDVPRKPHPQCFCFVTPVSPSEDEFLDGLLGGKYDSYLKSKMSTPPAPRPSPAVQKPTPVAARPKAATAPPSATSGISKELQDHINKINRIQGAEGAQTARALLNQARFAPNAMRRLDNVSSLSPTEERAFYARFGKDALGGYVPGENRLLATRQVFGSRYEQTFQKELKSGWSSKCGHSGAESFIAHECGHHMDAVIRRGGPAKAKEIWSTLAKELNLKPSLLFDKGSLDRWVAKNSDVLRKGVSKYGATDSEEIIAEIWAEYTTNPNARAHIKAVGQVIQRIVEAAS